MMAKMSPEEIANMQQAAASAFPNGAPSVVIMHHAEIAPVIWTYV